MCLTWRLRFCERGRKKKDCGVESSTPGVCSLSRKDGLCGGFSFFSFFPMSIFLLYNGNRGKKQLLQVNRIAVVHWSIFPPANLHAGIISDVIQTSLRLGLYISDILLSCLHVLQSMQVNALPRLVCSVALSFPTDNSGFVLKTKLLLRWLSALRRTN